MPLDVQNRALFIEIKWIAIWLDMNMDDLFGEYFAAKPWSGYVEGCT